MGVSKRIVRGFTIRNAGYVYLIDHEALGAVAIPDGAVVFVTADTQRYGPSKRLLLYADQGRHKFLGVAKLRW
jgi:hypothetical protein